jgi:hypothetical protein
MFTAVESEIIRAARAFTGRLLLQLPVRDRFPLLEFRRGREDRVVFGQASDRSGMRPASTDDESNP